MTLAETAERRTARPDLDLTSDPSAAPGELQQPTSTGFDGHIFITFSPL